MNQAREHATRGYEPSWVCLGFFFLPSGSQDGVRILPVATGRLTNVGRAGFKENFQLAAATRGQRNLFFAVLKESEPSVPRKNQPEGSPKRGARN